MCGTISHSATTFQCPVSKKLIGFDSKLNILCQTAAVSDKIGLPALKTVHKKVFVKILEIEDFVFNIFLGANLKKICTTYQSSFLKK